MPWYVPQIVLILLFMLTTGSGMLFAQQAGGAPRGTRGQGTIEVRVASPLPRESPWGRTLERIAAEWSRITNRQVTMRALHGGTEGGEGRMHLSLASNNIQAAIFTSFGLSDIYPAILTFSSPFLIRTKAELNVVMNELQSDIEAELNSGDYFMVAWSKAGFVNVFSRDPVFTPDDLRRMRIASNAEAGSMNAVFSTMGFQVVETEWVDVGPKIATGAVAAIYQSPAAVAALQLHSRMRNMLALNLAPILGGIVINQTTWRRIGELNPNYQAELLRATRRIAAEFDDSMERTINDAILAMQRDGLVVNTPTPEQEQLWFADIDRAMPALVGESYDRALYQRINEILTRYRSGS